MFWLEEPNMAIWMLQLVKIQLIHRHFRKPQYVFPKFQVIVVCLFLLKEPPENPSFKPPM